MSPLPTSVSERRGDSVTRCRVLPALLPSAAAAYDYESKADTSPSTDSNRAKHQDIILENERPHAADSCLHSKVLSHCCKEDGLNCCFLLRILTYLGNPSQSRIIDKHFPGQKKNQNILSSYERYCRKTQGELSF